ncbi:choline ABC transporter ATP-binding protein [Actibacterium sp. 188UL27-1]|uniref:choline ABC transporter ATP-binding protein n=1 Tax=Actibacterium sp. 188UL27-1 TaxID=2786961 RepID=UPI0019569AB9|nr:choline ABC transporter ATP-binding protein [Actibacterium sp. 188UL27-1]MBM7067447.1 choline ABC transporter ATP-binding protein [Actibacterium sp. 188UL27-1]
MNDIMVRFDAVNIVFGKTPKRALPLMDQGLSRSEIQAQTDQVLGVHDCTLDVHNGEILVLMGLSGSGKSTLLRAVNGLNPVIRGKVDVTMENGVIDVVTASARDLRKLRTERVAMVFQQFGLLPWRTVLDNVAYGLEVAGLRKEERNRRAREQLDLVNLTEWADRQVQELSGGMQQRVGLARAFATDAPILLMDEPFSALDPLIRTKLQDELLQLQQRLGRTIIFVSHDLDEALKIGNRIAIMEGGRIVQCAEPQDIVLNPATPYVAEFVAHMNPLNVLRATEIMSKVAGPMGSDARMIPSKTPLRDIIQMLVDSPRDIVVTDPSGPIGVIDTKAALSCLLRAQDVEGDLGT